MLKHTGVLLLTWALDCQRWASGCLNIGQPIWYQHRRQIWRVRMNACA